MITVVWLFIATAVAGHFAGSKLKATEGHNVSLHFDTGLEKVDEVRIMFGEGKRKPLLAKYCSPHTFPICKPIETPHHLQVKGGNVSLFLVNVNISWSGLYTAQIITDNHEVEVTNTLVVNQAPVSSSPAPPHSSSSSTPPRSTDLQWLVPVTVIVISLVIVVSGGVCFWKHRKKRNSTETPAISRSSLSKENNNSKNNRCDCVSVDMNGDGDSAEALLVP